MDKKEVTHDDSIVFWDAFMVRHPEIYSGLYNGIAFIDGSICAFQPAKMDNDAYRIFQRYLSRWLSENDFMEPQLDLIYVSLNDDTTNGTRAIDTASIIKLEAADNDLTRVTFKEDGTDKILSIYVKEGLEKLKGSVYIF